MSSHELLPLAWAASVAAARFLRDERPRDLIVESKSTPVDSVTEMDRGAESRLVNTLLGARPTDGFLGEEGGERLGTSGVRWVVDPLDGTVNYLYRIPMWSVSVAAEINDESVLGIVVVPEYDEAYVGIKGHGAWLIRHALTEPSWVEQLQVRECEDVATAMVATGFGYSAQRRQEQAAVVLSLAGQVRDFRRMGCATVDFCWLARGRLDAYYERGLNRWDVAAGALIAAEAGAIVTGLWGENPHEETMVAAVPGIALPMRELLRKAHG
ncbi:MAG: inositol monophosphatase [Actinobacteria bacterium]|nr:inositol monophosphatase [Actinomycetota bacterium]MSY39022.1 inositol monophosphatase [Actinomycetota bacterium]MSZ41775.1 inositol monophosphatase [Actinomycetota bacterium]